MAASHEPERSIREVMERGGWVRRTLNAYEVPLDPNMWQGQPGAYVAAGLLTELVSIDMSTNPRDEQQRAEVIGRCSSVLGNVSVPVVAQPIEVM